jgi:hypothetical protein
MTPELRCEWRQFRLASRDSIRRLLDRVVVSQESDPVQFALWAAVLAVTPPLLVGVRKLTQYAFLEAVGAADPTLTARILTAERVFFVLYGMLASALLAALIWEAPYPDRADQEIVGVLPVRPRTLAAARRSPCRSPSAPWWPWRSSASARPRGWAGAPFTSSRENARIS